MDPRRARDPRLARVDPRLQRLQSDTPASTPPPLAQQFQQSVQQFQPQWTENGFENHATSSTEMAFDEADSQPQQTQTTATTYKQRPLFCVVCASNQVSFSCLFHSYLS